MSKKTYYKLWFAIGALYLLGAIYPLNVAQRTAGHRNFSIVMGVFFPIDRDGLQEEIREVSRRSSGNFTKR